MRLSIKSPNACAIKGKGVRKLEDMPENVKQGGVYSTVGGKAILRKVYHMFKLTAEGIATGFFSIVVVVYLLFADDDVVFGENLK